MLVHIQSRHFSLSEALSKYVKNKVQIMLGRYEAKIIRADVSLFDINGPKGGEDKCCKIIVKINGTSSIVVQETAEDLYDAINTCSRRVRRAVKRQLSIHVRTPRKIKEILLLASKEAEIRDTLT
ncbi:MAG: putative sigma-54 modulation protein [Paraglaciecola sp.]|jgi:putative sigma-54 modulation protein